MPYLDLRDLAKELEDLEDLRTEAEEEKDIEFDKDDSNRLIVLRELHTDLGTGSLSDYADNEPTLIPESEFEEYAQDLADECGYTGNGSSDENPLLNYIDWAGWARDLKMDYYAVDFEGVTYCIRAG